MWTSVLVCFAALLLLYFVFIQLRIDLEKTRERIDQLHEKILEAKS